MDNNILNDTNMNTNEWPIPAALFINLNTMQLESLQPDEVRSDEYVLLSDLLVEE